MERLVRDAGLHPVFNVDHGRDAVIGFCLPNGVAPALHAAIAETVARGARPRVTPDGLDEEEAAWWARYAEQADEICWVQTPRVRRVVRGAYVRKIVESVPEGGTVLDFGCGTGWLSELLAECGARRVVGVDDSGAQIAPAGRRP